MEPNNNKHMQKELKQLCGAISKWVKVNNGEVSFIGSFISFDKKKLKESKGDATKDTIIVGFGYKKELELALGELNRNLKKEKGLVNW